VPIPSYSAGQKLSARDLNKLTGEVDRQSSQTAKPPFYSVDTGAGRSIQLQAPFKFWVRITSVASGVHDWTEVEFNGPGSHRDKDGGRTGTNLYEVQSGSAAVDDIVELWAVGENYFFKAGAGSGVQFIQWAGTALSHTISSGLYTVNGAVTFPTTGYYLITGQFLFTAGSGSFMSMTAALTQIAGDTGTVVDTGTTVATGCCGPSGGGVFSLPVNGVIRCTTAPATASLWFNNSSFSGSITINSGGGIAVVRLKDL
jgi:hypothetical protein